MISIVLAIVFLFFAVLFLIGKGDKLIAGYNTASEEERRKIDVRRLRIVIAVLMVMTAAFCAVLPFMGNDTTTQLLAAGIFCAITVVDVIVANTWAKKK